MRTKKKVLIISASYPIFFGVIFLLSQVCQFGTWCSVSENSALGLIIFILFPLLPVFLFSLITYKLHQEVFDHWMKFALWATPLLMVLTFLINGGGNNGIGVEGVIGGGFDVMLYMIFYGLYVGISLWRILSKYHALKDK